MQKTVKSTGLNSRIAEIISHLGISQTAFAKSLSTTTSRITNITQGRNKPDSQLLAAIAVTYPDIDTTWLLTGKGHLNRNVNHSSSDLAEDYTGNSVVAASQNPYLNPTQTHTEPSKQGNSSDRRRGNKIDADRVFEPENQSEAQQELVRILEISERLHNAGKRAGLLLGDKERRERMEQKLDKQRKNYQKVLYHLNNQRPELAEHKNQIERLGWLVSDAKDAIEEHFTIQREEIPLDFYKDDNSEPQSFEQLQKTIVEGLEHSLPYAAAAAALIDALTSFLAAMPAVSESEQDTEVREMFQRGLSGKMRKAPRSTEKQNGPKTSV